ncbi:MAG: hypothetical protein WC629_00490 [Candidatus Paceibacterota bacterium]|jgi:hypothetical protein
MIQKVFGINFARLTKCGVFEISKFRNELQAVMDLVGLEWHTNFNILGKDFDQIERAGSTRLCRAILDCMEQFFETRSVCQDCEFCDFYNVKEHGGANERTFEHLEITLRDRLEDLRMTLKDFGESEDSLSHYRDFWRTCGLLKPFSRKKIEVNRNPIHASP